jgi:hypothetical protein
MSAVSLRALNCDKPRISTSPSGVPIWAGCFGYHSALLRVVLLRVFHST